eukprot:CAMPEP_0194561902 /NCGR_PEP_ID=MMETSP0292-20121207/2518_1 /TAXON_ID=39354 /ORGANISM="Heterosigma akashiwo, Strain CCMP2393" /LENGTH=281 /DNA_ID=CAMNT_0039410417 /DNA_START=77 /DNA_END=923 /DNA_ORIENTATION=+
MKLLLALQFLLLACSVLGYQVSGGSQLTMKKTDGISRAQFLAGAGAVIGVSFALPQRSLALVKGSAPPPSYGKIKREEGEGKRDIAAAKEAAYAEIDREKAEEEAAGGSFKTTSTQVRYKDLVEGTGDEVKAGSTVASATACCGRGSAATTASAGRGEGSQIFSYGYGEDDDRAGATLEASVGAGRFVAAVDEAIVGMRVGGVRRVQVRPDKGWNKASVDPRCAPTLDLGKTGTVPGGITAVEGCIDTSLLPAPVGFQAQRKFARRFDESLIAEIELVGIK